MSKLLTAIGHQAWKVVTVDTSKLSAEQRNIVLGGSRTFFRGARACYIRSLTFNEGACCWFELNKAIDEELIIFSLIGAFKSMKAKNDVGRILAENNGVIRVLMGVENPSSPLHDLQRRLVETYSLGEPVQTGEDSL
jgi:hypothetical protein